MKSSLLVSFILHILILSYFILENKKESFLLPISISMVNIPTVHISPPSSNNLPNQSSIDHQQKKPLKKGLKAKNNVQPNTHGSYTLTYEQELLQFLKSRMSYPEEALKKRLEGRLLVQFYISPSGQFLEPTIVKASHHPILNRAAISLIFNLNHFKPPPQLTPTKQVFTLPIEFKIDTPK